MRDDRFTRGSEWRKWDLHFHTPSSHDYIDKSISNKLIIDRLLESNIAAVAITDHNLVDVNRIKKLQEISKNQITIFPGIEFCSELGGKEPIHFIAIFSEKLDIETIWKELEVRLCLSKSKDKENLQCCLAESCRIIHELGGVASIHAGSKTNSIENIKNSMDIRMQQKKKILSEDVDILELGKVEEVSDYRRKVFPEIGLELPMIICSDNHNIKGYKLKQNCWIKADNTFEGLKQIIFEPSERIRIQKDNPDLDFEKTPFTEIQFNTEVDIFEDETDDIKFGKGTIPLNNNLVSIIGGRGTGKSILIDYFASGLGKSTTKEYTKSSNCIIKRKTSLKDEEKEFVISEYPNVPFMYIPQSQIKSIVEKSEEFTKNIRETIGVTEEYSIPADYHEKAEDYVNKYFKITGILKADGTDCATKKSNIDKEIKRYRDFIANITSEENKPKLEKYREKVTKLEELNKFIEKANKLIDRVLQFKEYGNYEIKELNLILSSEIGCISSARIPLLDNEATIGFMRSNLLPMVDKYKKELEYEISETKGEFSYYRGDLSTLLDNIYAYRREVVKLEDKRGVLRELKMNFPI